jgi:hypothetical protein
MFLFCLQLNHVLESVFKNEGGLSQYLTDMRKQHIWGDGVMLETATQLYNHPIIVHYISGKVIYINNEIEELPIHVGYLNDNHYISIVPLITDDEPLPKISRMDNTENDNTDHILATSPGLFIIFTIIYCY